MATQFEAGKMYKGRSIGDADCIIVIDVLSRTRCTIKAKTARGVQTFRVGLHNNIEYVKPWGSYSMAPHVFADRVQS